MSRVLLAHSPADVHPPVGTQSSEAEDPSPPSVDYSGLRPFQWTDLSPSRAEDIITACVGLARALHYALAPLLEGIRSNAELVKGAIEIKELTDTTERTRPGTRVSPYMRLCYIAQQAMVARQILEEAQQLSSITFCTRHGISMLDLQACLPHQHSKEKTS